MPTGKSPHVPLGPPQGKPLRLWLSLLGESDWGPWAQPRAPPCPKQAWAGQPCCRICSLVCLGPGCVP